MNKILFLIGQLSNGGAERVVSVLANSFSRQGYSVAIVTLIKDEVSYELDEEVDYINIKTNYSNKVLRIINRGTQLRKIIKKEKPDVILSFTTEINMYAIVANLFLKYPLIISERNDPYNDPPFKLVRSMRNILYKKAKGYVFQTPDAKAYFSKLLNGKGVIIPNPISENLPLRYEGDRTKTIVTVSRLYEQKNLALLLRAFAQLHKKLNQYKLEIYGDGPLKDALIKKMQELQLEQFVEFKGFQKNVCQKIKDAALFVLPSNYEGISNAMLEAMAIGLPAVCTDCPIGGARMFIQSEKNGILVPVNDEAALTDAMYRVLTNKEFADELSKSAVEIRKELSADIITKKWMNYINDMVM